MQDIRKKYTAVKEQVEQTVFHPYLLKYIEKPVIDEDKLLFLISIMDRLELSYREIKTYALTTMLIQIALDTHEHISNAVVDEKNRQLTVLAGDYYSGLYYKLLAESEDIKLIQALSQGIKIVNEHKISVYQNECDEIEKLISSIKHIESSILSKLTEYFRVDLWNEFMANLLLVKRLNNEKSQFINTGTSLFFETMKNIIFPKTEHSLKELTDKQQQDLLLICDHYIELSNLFILKGIREFPYSNEMLNSRISEIMSEYQPIAKT